jgi:DNA mismatch repair protein MutS
MKNYYEIKAQYPDVVLLFRCGDIYESYHEDAQACHDILGISTSRRDDMCVSGFPVEALECYLPKLVRAGKRVALCDSINNLKKWYL